MTKNIEDKPSQGKPASAYVIQGDIVTLGNSDTYLTKSLPPGIYRVVNRGEKTPVIALKKEENTEFKLPKKIFGDFEEKKKTILDSWIAKESSMGVLLDGEPGTGKTILMKALSIWAIENDIPVIIIDQCLELDQVFALLDNEIGRAVIQFDEFEKVFEDTEAQNKVLTFLDGVVERNFLSILCVNDSTVLEKPLLTRPSRIRYKFLYKKLTAQEVEEVVDYFVKGVRQRKDILKVASSLEDLTYDNVISLIQEVKQKKVSAEKAAMDLALKTKWFVVDKVRPNVYVEIYLDKSDKDISNIIQLDITSLSEELRSGNNRGSVDAEIDDEHDEYNVVFPGGQKEMTGRLQDRFVKDYNETYLDLAVKFKGEGAKTLKGIMRIFRNNVF